MRSRETRILSLPSLKAEHALVSMPRTAWYWLDDLVSRKYPSGGYKALMKTFGATAGSGPECPQSLSASLRSKAQEHCEARMAALYNLANDNMPAGGLQDLKNNPSFPDTPDISARMPTVYRLFHFMPHATYLTTIWERRNYHQRPEKL